LNPIGKGKGTHLEKRKKGSSPPVLECPKIMPSKLPFTHVQLIYQAINGKATLQEICDWIMTTYNYYKYMDSAWMVRELVSFPKYVAE